MQDTDTILESEDSARVDSVPHERLSGPLPFDRRPAFLISGFTDDGCGNVFAKKRFMVKDVGRFESRRERVTGIALREHGGLEKSKVMGFMCASPCSIKSCLETWIGVPRMYADDIKNAFQLI